MTSAVPVPRLTYRWPTDQQPSPEGLQTHQHLPDIIRYVEVAVDDYDGPDAWIIGERQIRDVTYPATAKADLGRPQPDWLADVIIDARHRLGITLAALRRSLAARDAWCVHDAAALTDGVCECGARIGDDQ